MNRFQHTFSNCKKSHYDVPAGKCNNFDKSLVTSQRPPLRSKIQIWLKIILKKHSNFLATSFSQLTNGICIPTISKSTVHPLTWAFAQAQQQEYMKIN